MIMGFWSLGGVIPSLKYPAPPTGATAWSSGPPTCRRQLRAHASHDTAKDGL
jgi:hypothetical protein